MSTTTTTTTVADDVVDLPVWEGTLDEETCDNKFAEMLAISFAEQYEGTLEYDENTPTTLRRPAEDGDTVGDLVVHLVSDEEQGAIQVFAGDTDQLLVLSLAHTVDEAQEDDLAEVLANTILEELGLGDTEPVAVDNTGESVVQ